MSWPVDIIPTTSVLLGSEKEFSSKWNLAMRSSLHHTVDYISFSYYMSKCAAADPGPATRRERATCCLACAIPTCPESEWGWQIDPDGLRYTLNYFYDRIKSRCSLRKMVWAHRINW